jgi:hypothetical protein
LPILSVKPHSSFVQEAARKVQDSSLPDLLCSRPAGGRQDPNDADPSCQPPHSVKWPYLLWKVVLEGSTSMADNTDIALGNNWHTLFSDELWFLVIPPRPAQPFLEGRFQTDAAERTGWPSWVGSDYCVFHEGEKATCRLPLSPLPTPGQSRRFAYISDAIWNRLVEECAKLSRSDRPTQP